MSGLSHEKTFIVRLAVLKDLLTSSSTAEAESLSPSLVRQGKALKTVSTGNEERGQHKESQRLQLHTCLRKLLRTHIFIIQYSSLLLREILTLRACVPSSPKISHHFTGGQVTVEILK